MSKPTCATCAYFQLQPYVLADGGRYGECRKNPPVVVAGTDAYGPDTSSFPAVRDTGWCGQHSKTHMPCPKCLDSGMHPHCPECGKLCNACMYVAYSAAPRPGCTRIAGEQRLRERAATAL